MDWREAQEFTLESWQAIRASVGQAETLDLLVQINAMTALCAKAREDAGGDINKCHYCAFYQQFGGCEEISAQMSERVVRRDWAGLQVLVDRFIENLENLHHPPEEIPEPVL